MILKPFTMAEEIALIVLFSKPSSIISLNTCKVLYSIKWHTFFSFSGTISFWANINSPISSTSLRTFIIQIRLFSSDLLNKSLSFHTIYSIMNMTQSDFHFTKMLLHIVIWTLKILESFE
jgi:hypothetical protein